MLVVLTATIVVSAFGVGVAWFAGSQAIRRLSQTVRLNIYRLLLAVSLVPYGFFVRQKVQFAARSGSLPKGIEMFGYYPGVMIFIKIGALIAVGLLICMPKRRIIPYDQKLKPLARQLRKNMTHAEKKLWQVLRRKQIHGYTFLRQRPIGQYIVDFYCPDLMLAVEVDGRSHDGNYEADIRRQRRLESLGVYVLRFNDGDAMKDEENVRCAIGGWVEKHAPR